MFGIGIGLCFNRMGQKNTTRDKKDGMKFIIHHVFQFTMPPI
jgi:hypothetical protein